jgi:hypothetical protein
MVPRAGLDAVEKKKTSCPSRELNSGRPAVARRYADSRNPIHVHRYNSTSKLSLDFLTVLHTRHYQKPITAHDARKE